jgi:pyruvate dehydrogenase E2 component (dihydrolipoamide acetyltransferase)
MGGYGVEKFTATLNGTAILAVGSCHKAPVVLNDVVEVKNVMNVCLTSDHRLIDGSDAANFLRFFRMAMLNPDIILL